MVKGLASAAAGSTGERGVGLALLIAVLAAATVGAALGVQRAGYIPCELCLLERNPYYLGVPLALAVAFGAWRGWRALTIVGFALLAALFVAGAALGAYHAGVEWSLWPGPSGCSGPAPQATSVSDFLAALKSQRPVRCDAPALLVLGLSLAAWNALASLLLAGLALIGAILVTRSRAGLRAA